MRSGITMTSSCCVKRCARTRLPTATRTRWRPRLLSSRSGELSWKRNRSAFRRRSMLKARRNFETAFALTGKWREAETLRMFHVTVALLLAVACGAKQPAATPDDDFEFANPTAVTIAGYSGDAMEPFITRDGRYLIFNNSNEIPSETDLHWAERIDDLTFAYRGKLEGANSPALDAVASVDSNGTIYFVTTRSYDQTLMTIYRGQFNRGVVRDVAPV